MPSPRLTAEREEAALLCEKQPQYNVRRIAFRAFDAVRFRPFRPSPHYTDRIHPALRSFADEALRHAGAPDRLCGARWRCLPSSAIASLGPVARTATPMDAGGQAGLERGRPLAPGLCRQPVRFVMTKQRLTRFSGIPRVAARTCCAGRGADDKPVAELEIYRPGGEFDHAGPAIANRRPDGPGRHARAGGRGRDRQQVRHGDAAAA